MGDRRLPLAVLEQELALVAGVRSAGKLAGVVVAGRSAVADKQVVADRRVVVRQLVRGWSQDRLVSHKLPPEA